MGPGRDRDGTSSLLTPAPARAAGSSRRPAAPARPSAQSPTAPPPATQCRPDPTSPSTAALLRGSTGRRSRHTPQPPSEPIRDILSAPDGIPLWGPVRTRLYPRHHRRPHPRPASPAQSSRRRPAHPDGQELPGHRDRRAHPGQAPYEPGRRGSPHRNPDVQRAVAACSRARRAHCHRAQGALEGVEACHALPEPGRRHRPRGSCRQREVKMIFVEKPERLLPYYRVS